MVQDNTIMISNNNKGKIYIIGTGPGHTDHLSTRALKAIEESSVIIGYSSYIEMINDIISDKEIISSRMGKEIERAGEAILLAQSGKIVSMISGGDAGIYGMAGPIFEVLKMKDISSDDYPNIEVIPGISGLNAAASLLGAPIMHDFASISLSDLLTDWDLIETRIRKASEGDFVIIIYNPKSKGRSWQINRAREIILESRKGSTPVGIVENGYRKEERINITTLDKMTDFEIGMRTIIIVGNSNTFTMGKYMVTPRGYKKFKE